MTETLVIVRQDELGALIEAAVRKGLQCREIPAEWVDATEAARILGIHPRTVLRRAKGGQLRGRRVGRLWRFRRADLEREDIP